MTSRKDPSTSKVQYLLHLRESHCCCAKSCREAATTAQLLCDRINLHPTQSLYDILDALQACKADLLYLADELEAGTTRIDEVKQLAIDQMELFDKRRNRIIGTLIAVYVPLAFATVSNEAT